MYIIGAWPHHPCVLDSFGIGESIIVTEAVNRFEERVVCLCWSAGSAGSDRWLFKKGFDASFPVAWHGGADDSQLTRSPCLLLYINIYYTHNIISSDIATRLCDLSTYAVWSKNSIQASPSNIVCLQRERKAFPFLSTLGGRLYSYV